MAGRGMAELEDVECLSFMFETLRGSVTPEVTSPPSLSTNSSLVAANTLQTPCTTMWWLLHHNHSSEIQNQTTLHERCGSRHGDLFDLLHIIPAFTCFSKRHISLSVSLNFYLAKNHSSVAVSTSPYLLCSYSLNTQCR